MNLFKKIKPTNSWETKWLLPYLKWFLSTEFCKIWRPFLKSLRPLEVKRAINWEKNLSDNDFIFSTEVSSGTWNSLDVCKTSWWSKITARKLSPNWKLLISPLKSGSDVPPEKI